MERTDRALLLALAKVKWPPSKYRLVCYLVANDSGNPLGTVLPQVPTADETGMSENTIWGYFRELVAERVLLRHEAAGTRGHAYRVNPRFDEWRVAWLGAHPRYDDRAPRAREAALAHLAAVLNPPAGRKPGFVARPGARQEPIAARSAALLFGGSDAPGRASDAPLATRPGARQAATASTADTYLPITEELTHSVSGAQEVSKNGEIVLATIAERAGTPVFGKLARGVRQVVPDEGDVADLVAAVHAAPPRLAITAYLEIVGQAVARRDLEVGNLDPPRPQIAEWREAEPDEPPAPPPWVVAGVTAREWAAIGAPACETATGGAQ